MAPNRPQVLDVERSDPEKSQCSDRIGDQILQTLGAPTGLRAVNVRRLWENHYRANVVVGEDAISSTVAHSYFVVADATGSIVSSNPEIRRQY
jgi:hypothetical protein